MIDPLSASSKLSRVDLKLGSGSDIRGPRRPWCAPGRLRQQTGEFMWRGPDLKGHLLPLRSSFLISTLSDWLLLLLLLLLAATAESDLEA